MSDPTKASDCTSTISLSTENPATGAHHPPESRPGPRRRLPGGRWPSAVAWAVIAISPALVTAFLVRYYFNVGLLGFTPSWSDEIDYWHQVATFRAVGFAGGFYGVDEAQAKLSFLHFGSHGPAFPMLMAGISAVAGWRPFSGPLINMGLMAAAIFGYLALSRAGWVRTALTGALVLTFWPVMLYLSSTMQETVQQALAIVLAGVFVLLIRRDPRASRTVFAAGIVLLALAGLLRPTWALLFLPLFFLRGTMLSGRQLVWAALKAVPAVAAAFGLWVAASTPFPGFFSQVTELTARSPLAGTKLLILHIWTNAKGFVGGEWLELGLRAALLAIVVSAAVLVVRHLRRSTAGHHEDLAAGAFHLLNLVPMLVMVVVVYDVSDWRDSRVLAPHVLLSALVALARSERVVVIITLATNLALIGAFGPVFFELHQQHFFPADPKAAALSRYITYKGEAPAWENTLMVDLPNYDSGLLDVPAGVGLTLRLRGTGHQVQSRYLLVTKETALEVGLDRLRLLTSTARGGLYSREN
ncbi:hypothetical protein [Nonomuraea sp. NPDC049158]|uniref:hypothetical protein n=1 Tax=Nonomuraea sp. NPDC049158 TaxID=3155649 RepID=UPI0033F0609D